MRSTWGIRMGAGKTVKPRRRYAGQSTNDGRRRDRASAAAEALVAPVAGVASAAGIAAAVAVADTEVAAARGLAIRQRARRGIDRTGRDDRGGGGVGLDVHGGLRCGGVLWCVG